MQIRAVADRLNHSFVRQSHSKNNTDGMQESACRRIAACICRLTLEVLSLSIHVGPEFPYINCRRTRAALTAPTLDYTKVNSLRSSRAALLSFPKVDILYKALDPFFMCNLLHGIG